MNPKSKIINLMWIECISYDFKNQIDTYKLFETIKNLSPGPGDIRIPLGFFLL